jgi:hypothetical protein
MGFRGYNLNTFVKQHGIINIMQHINTEHKNLKLTNIGYIVFTDLGASHIPWVKNPLQVKY